MKSLSDEQLLYCYSEGKWAIKDIVLHLADCERVIIYRAMRIARADKTDLPGFALLLSPYFICLRYKQCNQVIYQSKMHKNCNRKTEAGPIKLSLTHANLGLKAV